MALTDFQIRSFKPKAKVYRRSDGAGLMLEITPAGSRLWRYRYRHLGSEKVLSLGAYPIVSLAEARRKRDDARRLVDDGISPADERKQAKRMAHISANQTFGRIAEEFVELKFEQEGRSPVTVAKARWLIDQLGPICDRPISEIKPIEVLAALKKLEARRKHETARRCRSFASRVFRYAVATGRTESDPAALLQGALVTPKVKHHAALIEPKEVGRLLRAIDSYSGSIIVRLAMQISPHVMLRPGEIRLAEWCDIDFEEAVWRVPAERMKMRRPHMVPLSRQVVGYLEELEPLTGPDGYIFPALYTFKRPMSENTVNQALRRLGYSADEQTAHGFRTTASTLLNESGQWNPDAIERSLAHCDSGTVRGIYNRGQYWDERVRMHQWWSDYLAELREDDCKQILARRRSKVMSSGRTNE
jgi:integrase